MSKTALILGISGQDGAYLAKLLIEKGYSVHGSSRDAEQGRFGNLAALGLANDIQMHSLSLADFRQLLQVISKVEPDEIYNLAAQSSVGLSFEQPLETFESAAIGVLQLLEVLRYLEADIRLYNASSSECFGALPAGERCDENTPFSPHSPYATAKAAAFWATANYREAYGLFACSGILFNHESPLRPPRFVTQKIVRKACEIARGSPQKLQLGRLDIWRDWGYAPEYVDAMWRMLQQQQPKDYVIATGESHSLEAFLDGVFSRLQLQWQDHVTQNQTFHRPFDVTYNAADPSLAATDLDWRAQTKFDQLLDILVSTELASLSSA